MTGAAASSVVGGRWSVVRRRSVLPFLLPSSLLIAYLVRTRAPARWRRPLLAGTLAVTLTAAVAVRAGAATVGTIVVETALVGEKARAGEAEIGDLIADAIRAATGADIAFVAAGEIREVTLGPGPLTVDRIAAALTDGDDAVVVLSLSGVTIRQALEEAVHFYPAKYKGFLQVSGLEFTFDAGREPYNRVTSVTAGGQPLQDGHQYRVAMSSSLAAGGYGYLRLWKPDRPPGDKGLTLAGALKTYLRDRTQLNIRPGGRIIIRGGR